MSINFGELLERVLRDSSDDFLDGIATGGSNTTVVDTSIINKYNNNKFAGINPWTIFITSSATGPQNQYQTITSNVASTGTITFPTMTLPVNAGDAYAVCRPAMPIHTLEKRINDSLSRMYYPDNDTSLTTAVQKLEYTLPTGITAYTLRKVYIQSIINITNVNYWVETSAYQIKPGIGGTPDVLIFDRQPTPLRTIMLVVAKPHPKLSVYSDMVSAYIDSDLIVAVGVERVMWWKKVKSKNKKNDVQNWMDAKADLDGMMAENHTLLPQKSAKFLPLSNANIRR